MPYGKAYMCALQKIAVTNIHRKFCTPGLVNKILINALFVISLFGWPTAWDNRGRRLVHFPLYITSNNIVSVLSLL